MRIFAVTQRLRQRQIDAQRGRQRSIVTAGRQRGSGSFGNRSSVFAIAES
jgi:hypothetical protein